MDSNNKDLVEKNQVADTEENKDSKPASKKLDLAEIEGLAGGDKPIELPEIG